MVHLDLKKRTLLFQQSGNQRNSIKKITGAEPVTKNGNVRLRAGKLKYGIHYTQEIIKALRGRTKLRGTDGKYWNVKGFEIGASVFPSGMGKAKKRQVMGRGKFRHTPHKYQGINQLGWGKTADNLYKRKR